MEIRQLAESVLFEPSLDAKLIEASQLQDQHPRSNIPIPQLPARPHGLALDDPRPRQKFPGLKQDAPPQQRGAVLHHFANHELLAIELMAVFLLRFPDAHPQLRRDVSLTLGEEQRHLRLYQQRMAQYGVKFGDVPVSRFFWDCLAEMNGPLAYLAGMSLCLEQANLDFSRYYITRFTALGDEQTAALLQEVYEDEIGHVKLGARWFAKLKDPLDTRSFWERYQHELHMPLTPARAIGIGFDRHARDLAGLDDEFIVNLQAFSHSKGRNPDLYLFNPSAEFHLAAGHPTTLPEALAGLSRDLDTLPMFLGGRDDAVLVEQAPRPAFLASLRQAGFDLPRFLTAEQLETVGRLRSLRPWAFSPDSERTLAGCIHKQASLTPAPANPQRFTKSWSLALARRWNAECNPHSSSQHTTPWLGGADTLGVLCRNIDAALAKVGELRARGGAVVIKAPFGSAGRGMIRVLSDSDLPTAKAWIKKVLTQQHEVIVEPWLDRMLDLSMQISVHGQSGDSGSSARGSIRVHGITRFVTDRRGQYESTLLGDPLRNLDQDLKMAVIGPGKGWQMFDHLTRCARFVGHALREAGHEGPAGIDALVYRDGAGDYRLKPIVEVNPRYTMGHVALRIGRSLGEQQDRRFRIVSQAMAKRAGAASLAEFAAALPETAVCLTDPQRARYALAVLE